MKVNLVKGFVIAFAIAALGLMSAAPKIDASEPTPDQVQKNADNLYNTNKTVSDAYQQGWDQAQAAKQAAEEGEDEEEGGCCGGS
ncbi:MAG: hypothetical protein AUJ52_01175 [Elusimicrobia bacterium CG1_02_63_36]|nr:MAG: hypothetical protein AUJ52_01175 [Elusimicrobia bacterium CG1_02_63_36]